MIRKNLQRKRGFTLVEMLVSVAIFSIVVMISLGAILTILDANRKARTLTEVMNNLNFSVETMTRSLKTGVEPASAGDILSVGAIILTEDGFAREKTRYRLNKTADERGQIEQCISTNLSEATCDSNKWFPITSELVDVKEFYAEVFGDVDLNQPRTQIFISGTVKINEKISSNFSLQTTVSQRRLNLLGSELD